jgi:hypothetical protein
MNKLRSILLSDNEKVNIDDKGTDQDEGFVCINTQQKLDDYSLYVINVFISGKL